MHLAGCNHSGVGAVETNSCPERGQTRTCSSAKVTPTVSTEDEAAERTAEKAKQAAEKEKTVEVEGDLITSHWGCRFRRCRSLDRFVGSQRDAWSATVHNGPLHGLHREYRYLARNQGPECAPSGRQRDFVARCDGEENCTANGNAQHCQVPPIPSAAKCPGRGVLVSVSAGECPGRGVPVSVSAGECRGKW